MAGMVTGRKTGSRRTSDGFAEQSQKQWPVSSGRWPVKSRKTLGTGGTEALEFVEGAVVGALQGSLVAGEFGHSVAAGAVANEGAGHGIERLDGGAWFSFAERREQVRDPFDMFAFSAAVSADDADFHGCQTAETPGCEDHPVDQELFALIFGLVKG